MGLDFGIVVEDIPLVRLESPTLLAGTLASSCPAAFLGSPWRFEFWMLDVDGEIKADVGCWTLDVGC